MTGSTEPDHGWDQWPGRGTGPGRPRRGLRALFAPSDDAEDVEHLIDARGRELEDRIESLQSVIADLDEREERVARLRSEIETLLRDGSAELDQRHAELAVEANALREREAALARAEQELEARRSELGAVELRRAAVERLEAALQRRQADLERASGELRERAAQLDEREGETQAQAQSAPKTAAGRTDVHVLVVARDGYRLVQAPGPAPDAGSEIVLAGDRFTVTRTGPSPLPGDDRRCAFLERATP